MMMSEAVDALTDHTFAEIMDGFQLTATVAGPVAGSVAMPVAIAVSGGMDSLALVFLMNTYAKKHHIPLFTFTVNHNLRAEALAEAQAVHHMLLSHGIHHQILTWHFDALPKTRIQESAREARYALLWDACATKGVRVLMTAHHLNDQLETFFMRLNHRSGLAGLTAMRPETVCLQGRLIRPLLHVHKKRLQAYMVQEGRQWFDDPSNTMPQFERVRTRMALEKLEQEGGIQCESVGRSLEKLKDVNDFIETLVCDFFKDASVDLFSWMAFRSQHAVLQRRILCWCIQKLSVKPYVSPDASIERVRHILMKDDFKRATIGGLLFEKIPPMMVSVRPEPLRKSKMKL